MRIVLSKERPAQLDLLLRSLERNAPDEPTRVIVPQMTAEYTTVFLEHDRDVDFVAECGDFERAVRGELSDAGSFVTFLCDDDIAFSTFPTDLVDKEVDEVLCWSLRLGRNTITQYPSGLEQEWPNEWLRCYDDHAGPWLWRYAPLDFGYPGSLDGHIFRTDDVQYMLEDRRFANPTALECQLQEACIVLMHDRRPLMASYSHSVLVGNPVNRVSAQSGVRFGQTHPTSAAECLERFRAGERLDLDAMDFSEVDGAHTEIALVWK